MLIKESIVEYRHFDLGNIKLAFAIVCKDDLFRDVYFSANSLYYVESGTAILYCDNNEITLKKGEIGLIKQHSKINIRKIKDNNENKDFQSIIFYLFPDFITEFLKDKKDVTNRFTNSEKSIIRLGEKASLKEFSESLLPLFTSRKSDKEQIKTKTFEVLDFLLLEDKNIAGFLFANAKPIKIDLYEFMVNNILSDYDTKDLAQLTGRSLSAFKRDFKEIFNTSPHNWILRKKIDYAENLLKGKTMKAKDIYHFLSFKELSHFSAAFKKLKGISPNQV
jgi:AraC family transcriptional regulator, exoenzyme S synthesis regulatory protein ExsA